MPGFGTTEVLRTTEGTDEEIDWNSSNYETMEVDDIRNDQGERMDAAFHPGERTGVLLILGHGVTGDKDRPLLVALAEGLAKRGWPCLRISFSGNGESEGRFVDSCITKEVVFDAMDRWLAAHLPSIDKLNNPMHVNGFSIRGHIFRHRVCSV
jgi:alpha/beta superfamily hydrolase